MISTLVVRYLNQDWRRAAFDFSLLMLAYLILAGLLAQASRFQEAGRDEASANVLVFSKASLMQQLPASLGESLRALPGVRDAAPLVRFGAQIDKGRRRFASFAVTEAYLAANKELAIPPETVERWRGCAACMIVGADLMERQGWRVGQLVELQSDAWRQRNGNINWQLEIAGTYHDAGQGRTSRTIFLHYGYLDEGRTSQANTAGAFLVVANDPDIARGLAQRIDASTEATPSPTWSFRQNAANTVVADQLADVLSIVLGAAAAILVSIAVVVGNSFYWFGETKHGDFYTLRHIGMPRSMIAGAFAGRHMLIASAALAGSLIVAPLLMSILIGSRLSLGSLSWLLLQAAIGVLSAILLTALTVLPHIFSAGKSDMPGRAI